MAHDTLATAAEHEEVVKGSRFVAWVGPLARPADAEARVAAIRDAHPEAGHVAWALRWGEERRWSDDGEPGGTAGRPMLEVLEKRGLDRVLAVVARRFGGVKLGAGGLVRAYGGAVARAVDRAGVAHVPDRDAFTVEAPFADADVVLRALQAHDDVDLAPTAFGPSGVVVRGTVLRAGREALVAEVVERTRGRARCRTWPADEVAPVTGSSSG